MNKVKRKLTLRAVTVFAVALVILFSAVNYQRNGLYWTGYSVLSFLVCGLYVSAVQFRSKSVQWHWESLDWVFAGESIKMKGHWAGLHDSPVMFLHSEFGNHQEKANTPGLLVHGAIAGVTEYPLGLLTQTLPLGTPPSTWVYPKPVNHCFGQASQVSQAASLDYIRTYVDGDMPQRILKKTLPLPKEYWQVRSASPDVQATATEVLDIGALPKDWDRLMQCEQMSFNIWGLPETAYFTLRMHDGSTYTGAGQPHKHKCMRVVAAYYEARGLQDV